MFGWYVLAASTIVLGLYARHRIRGDRRTSRRRTRRARNLQYQRLWDQIMLRPRAKRLTFKDRKP